MNCGQKNLPAEEAMEYIKNLPAEEAKAVLFILMKMKNSDFDIIQMNVKDIKPYEKNAKKHPKEQVEYIANSIKEFGWRQPIVVDENNVVIIGHGRLMAAKKLKLKTCLVLIV